MKSITAKHELMVVVELIKKTLIEEMQKQTNYKESYVICKYKVSNLLSIIYPLRIGA